MQKRWKHHQVCNQGHAAHPGKHPRGCVTQNRGIKVLALDLFLVFPLLVPFLFPWRRASVICYGRGTLLWLGRLLSFRPFSPLCDDAHAPCHRLCLTQYLLRGYSHLDHDQQDLGGKSRDFTGALALCTCLLLRRSVGMDCSRKTPFANFVVLPNYHEDESTLKHLGHSPSPEKQVRIGLATEAGEGSKTQDKAERLVVSLVVAFLHEPGAGAA